MIFDASAWLGIASILIAFSGLARLRAPIRSRSLLALAIAMFLGFLGGIMRGTAVAQLGSLYAVAAPTDQASLRSSFLAVILAIRSVFHAGQLLQGIGFLVAGSIALGVTRFPRWLAYWVFLPGITSLVVFIVEEFAPDFFMPVLYLHVVFFIALQAVIGAKFWRVLPARAIAPEEVG